MFWQISWRLASICPPLAFPPTLSFHIIAVQNNSAGPLIPHVPEHVRADISAPQSMQSRPVLCRSGTRISKARAQMSAWCNHALGCDCDFEGIHSRQASRVGSRADTRIPLCAVMRRTDQSSIYRTLMGWNVVCLCVWGGGGVCNGLMDLAVDSPPFFTHCDYLL